ncbi:hypothetical protein VC83_00562 [Pseudogymnoascus destructans]|uniref:Uncharacterized protein n=1 Tax=Pseudogymnoascus destructans TaxID=655981 RepID=A0A177AM90_9PEZI|nr:uncharacterized protein VC83_00562 [Pseudogymnoascus destructans]OAF63189.1 hypothetical protein VC83_00562 [Pseudogymnoascus destructans]
MDSREPTLVRDDSPIAHEAVLLNYKAMVLFSPLGDISKTLETLPANPELLLKYQAGSRKHTLAIPPPAQPKYGFFGLVVVIQLPPAKLSPYPWENFYHRPHSRGEDHHYLMPLGFDYTIHYLLSDIPIHTPTPVTR